ncbi:MAG TPA: serine hydrolase domain-containing protein [Chloroflexia bacterium]|nr:serine hydrolase domain-containing protein [Chloroflexia bacterium]
MKHLESLLDSLHVYQPDLASSSDLKSHSSILTSGATRYREIESYIERQIARLRIPGVALAIVENDRLVYLRGFGRERPGGEAPTSRTPFFIGSLTKSITALAVMQLVEAGKLELDASVQRYLPWFRVVDAEASARITVRHLLNQTSGLPTSAGEIALANFDNSPGASERQARALTTLVLKRPVGAECEYSNTNYSLLGLIIEAVCGESYEEYLQKQIFDPLEMRHTYTSPSKAKQRGLAAGYRYWFGFPIPSSNLPLPHGSLAAGLVISTMEDMAHYMIAHLNGGRYGTAQILSPAGMAELHRGVIEYRKMGVSAGKYGMGWFESELGQTKLLWHSGTLPDFAAYMALLPEQKKGLVLLFNASHHWMNPVLTEFGTGVAALLAGEKPGPLLFMRLIPWALRGQVLIPAFQLAGVAATLRLLRRWHFEPEGRPSGRRAWGRHILLPLISNLALALTMLPLLSKRRGYLRLYMPDYSLMTIVCGGFSLGWSFLRTGLVLRALRRSGRLATEPSD